MKTIMVNGQRHEFHRVVPDSDRRRLEVAEGVWLMYPVCNSKGQVQSPIPLGEPTEIRPKQFMPWLRDLSAVEKNTLWQRRNREIKAIEEKLRDAKKGKSHKKPDHGYTSRLEYLKMCDPDGWTEEHRRQYLEDTWVGETATSYVEAKIATGDLRDALIGAADGSMTRVMAEKLIEQIQYEALYPDMVVYLSMIALNDHESIPMVSPGLTVTFTKRFTGIEYSVGPALTLSMNRSAKARALEKLYENYKQGNPWMSWSELTRAACALRADPQPYRFFRNEVHKERTRILRDIVEQKEPKDGEKEYSVRLHPRYNYESKF